MPDAFPRHLRQHLPRLDQHRASSCRGRRSGPEHNVTVCAKLVSLPVFSPDQEDRPIPAPVQRLANLIAEANGLILSSAGYVHAILGSPKNAIDRLVSRDELIGKPIALTHASHRGDDMLAQLRLVLATVSERFGPYHFLRFQLVKKAPEKIAKILSAQPKKVG